MDYRLRRLDKTDLTLMRSLNKLFGEVFEDQENYQSDLPSDSYLAAFLAEERNIVIVATCDNEVIGGLVAYHLIKFEMERSEVFLYDLAISKSHQRKGIGSKLLKKLQSLAHDIGAYVIFVQADEGDEAMDFYRSLNPSEDSRTRNFDFSVE